MKSKISELTERQRYWLAHVEACETSGLSCRAYADAHGIKVGNLYNARHLLKEKGVWRAAEADDPRSEPSVPSQPPAGFQRVVVGSEAAEESQPFSAHVSGQGATPCRIHLPNGVILEVMTGTDACSLAVVVNAAGAWP